MAKSACFNLAQFQKILAMMESPYSEEAKFVFGRAVTDLEKNQTSFIAQFDSAEDADEARAECERLRSELSMASWHHTTGAITTPELETVVNRLHDRMARMEEALPGFDPDYDPGNPPDPPEYVDEEDDPGQSDQASQKKPSWGAPADTQNPPPTGAASWGPAAQTDVASMPILSGVFWLGLVALIIIYASHCMVVGHLLRGENEWGWITRNLPLQLPVAALCVAFAWWLGRDRKFSQIAFGRFIVEHFSSGRSKILGLFCVLFLWFIAYIIQSEIQPQAAGVSDPLEATLGIWLSIFALGWVVWSTVRNSGWRGLLIKTALLADGVFLAFAVDEFFGQSLLSLAKTHAPFEWTQQIYSIILVFVTSGLVLSDKVFEWLNDDEVGPESFRPFTIIVVFIPAFALGLVLFYVVGERALSGKAAHVTLARCLLAIGVLEFIFLTDQGRKKSAREEAEDTAYGAPSGSEGNASHASKSTAKKRGWL